MLKGPGLSLESMLENRSFYEKFWSRTNLQCSLLIRIYLSGMAYHEALTTGPFQGQYGFHSPWFKAEFGKLGAFDITSAPNMGKTTLARTALSLASHPSFLFAFKVDKWMLQLSLPSLREWYIVNTNQYWMKSVIKKTLDRQPEFAPLLAFNWRKFIKTDLMLALFKFEYLILRQLMLTLPTCGRKQHS